jgi:hypothetical protein
MRMFAMTRAVALIALFAAVFPAQAQDYPSRPITLIVPYAAGGGNDLMARTAAEKMSKTLGHGRPLIILYVGDYDPSGMYMSEVDLPKRIAEYGGDHVTIKRIALTRGQLRGLPSFPASDKKKASPADRLAHCIAPA